MKLNWSTMHGGGRPNALPQENGTLLKFWLEPTISLVNYTGFSKIQLNAIQKMVEKYPHSLAVVLLKELLAGK